MPYDVGLARHEGAAVGLAAVLPDAVLVINAIGELQWGNLAAERLFGITLADVVGVNVVEFVHPDDLQLVVVAVASVQAKDVGTLLEVRVRTGDGWHLVEARGAPVGDNIVLSVRDITERRRWEIAGNKVARFRSLMQYGATVTLLLDRDGTVSASSGGLTRLLGHDQEWLEGRPLHDLVDDGDREALMAALREVRRADRNHAPVAIDLRIRRSDASVIPMAITFINLLDDLTIEGIVATGHDITDRIAAEEELRASHSLLAAALESTADGILVVGQDGQITTFNRTFAEMWRLSDHVLQSRDHSRALAAAVEQLCDPDAFLTKVNDLYATPDAHSHDVLEFKDGRVFERDSLPQRLGDAIVGRVWSFRDITEHQRLQQEFAHQALHDSLTGLANQALFRNRIEHAVLRLDRHERQLAVLFIDVDDFKNVNDTLGHCAGDALLVLISERLKENLRPGDTVARLGGDEFGVLVDDLNDPKEALNIAQRYIRTLKQPSTLAAIKIAATASIGIAYGTTGTNCDELLHNADLAMYAAKAAGKNCYRVFAT